jgi:hypothetical protein
VADQNRGEEKRVIGQFHSLTQRYDYGLFSLLTPLFSAKETPVRMPYYILCFTKPIFPQAYPQKIPEPSSQSLKVRALLQSR